jgi:hypothetical protein
MQPTSNPLLVAEQMLMAEGILDALANGKMPMHPAGYRELAGWIRDSFESIETAALRLLRDASPPELQGIAENVLHERRVLTWPCDDIVVLSSLAESLGLLRRCRRR